MLQKGRGGHVFWQIWKCACACVRGVVMVPLREVGEPDMLSSADSWWAGTIEPGLRLVRCSLQHAIIQECLSSTDGEAFDLESERTRLADLLEPLKL